MTFGLEIFTQDGGEFFARWLHILVGIAWIGLLYYFNFVQVPSFAGFDGPTRNQAIDKLASRALWWFRWSALATFVMGILLLYFIPASRAGGELALSDGRALFEGKYFTSSPGVAIFTGMLLGTIMLLNVWGVIWRNQKVVIANARNVIAGGEADPAAAEANRAALMASRQNTLFSFTMLWFMVWAAHFSFHYDTTSGGDRLIYWLILLVVVAFFELAALGVFGRKPGGLNWMYDSHKNTIIVGIGMVVFFYLVWEILFT